MVYLPAARAVLALLAAVTRDAAVRGPKGAPLSRSMENLLMARYPYPDPLRRALVQTERLGVLGVNPGGQIPRWPYTPARFGQLQERFSVPTSEEMAAYLDLLLRLLPR